MQAPQEVKDYLDLIDNNYREAKAKRISRLSVEWGVWSRKMNLEIRPLIEAGDDASLFYKYLFIYWTIKSQLLELHFRSRLWKQGKKKKLAKEAANAKETILTGDLSGEDGTPFDDIKKYLATKLFG